jgi:hypothetical protein
VRRLSLVPGALSTDPAQLPPIIVDARPPVEATWSPPP